MSTDQDEENQLQLLGDRIARLEKDFAWATSEIDRLRKYEELVNKAVEHLPEDPPLPVEFDGDFLVDYDRDMKTMHLFISRDDRSITLDVRDRVDLEQQIHHVESSITCALHIPSLKRNSAFEGGAPSEDVYEHIVANTDATAEDLIVALRWLVGEEEISDAAFKLSDETQEEDR